jgi:hypothetical protein
MSSTLSAFGFMRRITTSWPAISSSFGLSDIGG